MHQHLLRTLQVLTKKHRQADKKSSNSILKILCLARRNKNEVYGTRSAQHQIPRFFIFHHQSTSHTYQGGFCGTGVLVAGEKEISSPDFGPE